MQESPFTLRELRRSLAGQAAALVGLVLLFAFIGPFGTYDSFGVPGRIGYWAVAMGGNWLVCGSIMMLALVTAGGQTMRGRALVTAAAAPVAAAPGTGVVFAAEALFRPGYAADISVPIIYLSVAVLMLVIGLSVVTVLEVRRRLAEGGVAGRWRGPGRGFSRPPRPRAWERASSTACTKNLAATSSISRPPTTMWRQLPRSGSTLVLMHFVDAVAELDGAGGLRVHRTYWVASRHVTGAARRHGRTTLRLTGGHEVPVSRTYMAAARAAGLL